ncbi:MAG: radical SAM protein [Candidatus Woesearchaeota archaeon]
MSLLQSLVVGKSVLSARLLGVRQPVVVKFKLTSRCNSACRYCLDKKDSRDLSTAKVMGLLRQMWVCGTKRIGFFGGEVLLRKDLGKILEFCREKNIYTTLVTNGYLVPDNVSIISKANCLFISLDGPKKVHDYQRGEGSYEKVIRAIYAAKPHVEVVTHTTLTRYNVDNIKNIAELAKMQGFQATFCPIHFQKQLSPSNKDIRKAVSTIVSLKCSGYPILTSKPLLNYWLQWHDFSKPYSTKRTMNDPVCYAGKLYCEINSDGSMAPCDWTFRLSNSNALKQGFRTAFQSLPTPVCKACIRPWTAEYNLMFSLNPGTIWNYMKFVVKT